MAKGPRRYKQIITQTKDMGSAGAQVCCASITALDPQAMSGYLHNVRVSAILNEHSSNAQESGGIMCYLTTASSWSDDNVISARAMPQFGGNISLSAKRYIKDKFQDSSRNDGPMYVWVELTEATLTEDQELRVAVEAWGRGVQLAAF